jgi:thiol-disulfide isomerase/thioredoxin
MRKLLALALFILGFLVSDAHAGQAFDHKAFEAAQAADKPILVDITAPWCPTCRKQKPIIAAIEADPAFAGLLVFHVDYDTDRDALWDFKVQRQATLIIFKGKEERGRSVSETDADKIREMVKKAF